MTGGLRAGLLLLALAGAGAGCDTSLWLGDPRVAGGLPEVRGDAGDADVHRPLPCISLTPEQVAFRAVSAESEVGASVTLRNDCDAPRSLTGFYLGGDPGFSLVLAGRTYPLDAKTGTAGVPLSPPLVIDAHGSVDVAIVYAPEDAGSAVASLIWLTDDPAGGPTLSMSAQIPPPPCIASFPKAVDFGAVLVGSQRRRTVRLGDCGDTPLEVRDVALAAGASPGLSLELPASLAVPPPPGALDLRLAFAPASGSVPAGDGAPEPARTELIIRSNAFHSELRVPISSLAVDAPCPWAVIDPGVPEQVTVGQQVVLSGAGSFGVLAPVGRWAWEAAGPHGARGRFEPSPDANTTTLLLDVVGTWTLSLAVWDAEGRPGCAAAHRLIEVTPPPEGLHLELTWQTPGDLDPTDSGPGAGSDLDLHLLHPFATGIDFDGDGSLDGWFDQPFDVHWLNPAPDWGELGSDADDPRLSSDDTDGDGPESLALPRPAGAVTYAVGVHGWDDHGYGPSQARLAGWLDGVSLGEPLVLEVTEGELCHVAELRFPEGVLAPDAKPECSKGSPALTKPVPDAP
ncbi:MAG: hypothetical protein H6744_19295 [Deltaproteobacteria bacterium]|nr:hypothetical protein [Deltaproteobacteria bacterium]MCB9788830.1 hypothetical protein [Deltaproteobacteria bacterium]